MRRVRFETVAELDRRDLHRRVHRDEDRELRRDLVFDVLEDAVAETHGGSRSRRARAPEAASATRTRPSRRPSM